MRRSVFDVATWFLSRNIPITHKKLQKLCYYAQAWHCVFYQKPFFYETFEAWIHGPVAPCLYPKYADFGWNPIPPEAPNDEDFTEDELEVLNAVFDAYGDFSGFELESLTHSEDPWIEARRGIDPLEASHETISTETMRKFYAKMYRDGQGD